MKYSDEHGTLRLDVGRKKRRLFICVCNTCHAQPPIDTDKLFDRFYRAEPSHCSKPEGTGIGLSIAKATAEAHGGRISAAYNGSSITFTVLL